MGMRHDPLFLPQIESAEGIIHSVCATLFTFISTLAVRAVDTLYLVGFFVLLVPTVSGKFGSCTKEANTLFQFAQ